MYSIVKNAKTLHRVSGFRQAMKLFDQVVGRSDPFKDVIRLWHNGNVIKEW